MMISNMQCKRVRLLPVHRVIHFAKKIPWNERFLLKDSFQLNSHKFFHHYKEALKKPWCFSSETQQVSLKTFFLCLGLERISVKYFLSSQSVIIFHICQNLNLHWQNHWEIFQIASLQRWNKWNAAHYLRLKWIYFPWS